MKDVEFCILNSKALVNSDTSDHSVNDSQKLIASANTTARVYRKD